MKRTKLISTKIQKLSPQKQGQREATGLQVLTSAAIVARTLQRSGLRGIVQENHHYSDTFKTRLQFIKDQPRWHWNEYWKSVNNRHSSQVSAKTDVKLIVNFHYSKNFAHICFHVIKKLYLLIKKFICLIMVIEIYEFYPPWSTFRLTINTII